MMSSSSWYEHDWLTFHTDKCDNEENEDACHRKWEIGKGLLHAVIIERLHSHYHFIFFYLESEEMYEKWLMLSLVTLSCDYNQTIYVDDCIVIVECFLFWSLVVQTHTSN